MENENKVKQNNVLPIVAIVLSAMSILISGFTLAMVLAVRSPKRAPEPKGNQIECPMQNGNNQMMPNGQGFNDPHIGSNDNNKNQLPSRSQKPSRDNSNFHYGTPAPSNSNEDRPAVENKGPNDQNPFNF